MAQETLDYFGPNEFQLTSTICTPLVHRVLTPLVSSTCKAQNNQLCSPSLLVSTPTPSTNPSDHRYKTINQLRYDRVRAPNLLRLISTPLKLIPDTTFLRNIADIRQASDSNDTKCVLYNRKINIEHLF